jgi:hypothetical protein
VRRIILLLMLFALSATALGCGGGRERGKNSDFDRPHTRRK